MAAPFFDKATGHVVIVWYEAKDTSSSPKKHYYEAKPIKLQLHPKDPSLIIRIYFNGRMPVWMNRYIKEKEHPFECKEIFQNGIVGWWIANWRAFDSGMKPFAAPTIKGSISALVNLIPTVVEDYRERIRSNLDVIASNLAIDPSFYEPFGLYYRPEEITAEGGAMVIDEDLIPVRMSGESDLDFETRIRNHGRLDRLIFELTTPLPVSFVKEKETIASLGDDEKELDFSFQDEGEFTLNVVDAIELDENGEFLLQFEGEEDPLLGGLVDISREMDGDSNTFSNEVSAEAPNSYSGVEITGEAMKEVHPDAKSTADISSSEESVPFRKEVSSKTDRTEPASSMQSVEMADQVEQLPLHIVNTGSRKHSAVAGQLSFF